MQKEALKFVDSTVFEGMTSIRAIIAGIDAGVNNRRIEKILFDGDKLKKISKEVGYLRAVSDKYGFELVRSTAEELDVLTLGNTHGGIIAVCSGRDLPALCGAEVLPSGFYAMIQGIEDPYNFGYSLRSLYACGADGIILGGRNWMSAAGVVSRSSAGASERFNIYTADDVECVRHFSSLGYKIVCASEDTDNLLGAVDLSGPILLVVGGEKRGISKDVLDMADLLVKIPYAREFRASLSAASASTMFAYEIMRQRINKKI
ncbi:MAG: RNA methyltransferase [Clostridia bacterium]|nr:RNA methyltransferase [Clostridia bacterium]